MLVSSRGETLTAECVKRGCGLLLLAKRSPLLFRSLLSHMVLEKKKPKFFLTFLMDFK